MVFRKSPDGGPRWRPYYARARRAFADLELAFFTPERHHPFFVVTAVYNASTWIERCLESVASQRYDAARITHLVIDDRSTDDTLAKIHAWAESRRPAHAVEILANRENLGGCANYAAGFRRAPRDSVVLQLDGDDWLPDPLVLAYLDMVYHDPEVWMTYNSWIGSDGSASNNSLPVPRGVVARNAFRKARWTSSHLHSFRAPLFSHVRDESLIDPESGKPWRSAVDHACYLPMLELAGSHARHLDRITYVYNQRQESVFYTSRAHQLSCDDRIRQLPGYRPLARLEI